MNPIINFRNYVGYWQPFNAGYISPRAFVAAQQSIAAANMCRIIDDSVRDVVRQGIFSIFFA